jgi:hypothetical protein
MISLFIAMEIRTLFRAQVLHMEYGEFSKGAATIPELDFARILLRYTFLNTEDYHTILER